jgi:hypothetical protein
MCGKNRLDEVPGHHAQQGKEINKRINKGTREYPGRVQLLQYNERVDE